MADVNLRMVMLKDLLHAAGLPPLTSHDNTENGETNTFSVENQAQTPKLGLVGRTWSEAHEALPESVHRTAADKVSSAVRDGTIIWNEPIEYARAMKITLENRNARPVPNRRGPLEQVTFRASDSYHGLPRFDNVKVAVSDAENDVRLYFGRCLLFCKDTMDNYFCLLQWYEELDTRDPVVLLPKLKLSPTDSLQSYDVQPVESIVNGALIVENDETFWALQSPREIKTYERFNN